MRIIAGKWRGRQLEMPSQKITRPTTDRVREALFSILLSRVGSLADLYVFDAFAGSGALGFEALSRGAEHVFFAEKNQGTRRVLQNNVRTLKCENQVSIAMDAFKIGTVRRPFDLVFMDPPYGVGLESELFAYLCQNKLINAQTLFVVESHADNAPLCIADAMCIDYRIYGNCALNLFKLDALDPT